jgi:hypothetical protein
MLLVTGQLLAERLSILSYSKKQSNLNFDAQIEKLSVRKSPALLRPRDDDDYPNAMASSSPP